MDEKILARIRKLLAQAEGEAEQGHGEAADAFTRKASELIAKYGVDAALLAAEGKTRDEIIQARVQVDNPYSPEKADLLARIAHPLRARTVRYQRGRTVSAVIVLGFEADVERIQLLYTSLLLQASTQVSRARPEDEHRFGFAEDVAAYRRSWLDGFSSAVGHRLTEAEQDAVDAQRDSTDPDAAGVALVLRDRQAEVDEALREAFPRLKQGRRRSLSGMGALSGYRAGERANLHQQRGDVATPERAVLNR